MAGPLPSACVVSGYRLHWASVLASVKWGDWCALNGLLCASVCLGGLHDAHTAHPNAPSFPLSILSLHEEVELQGGPSL